MLPYNDFAANGNNPLNSVSQLKGALQPLSPFHPAQRLIELHCTHLPVLRFPKKNFAPGWPQSDEPKLGRPIASPALAFVFLVQQDSQRSFHACDNAQRRHLYFFEQVGFR